MGRKWNKYTDEELKIAVAKSFSLVETLRNLGYEKVTGGNSCHLKKKLISKGIDFSHFKGKGHNKGRVARNRLTSNQILIYKESVNRPKPHLLTRSLIEIGRQHCCEGCGIGPEWRGQHLTLHVDHIDGNWWNNKPENLRFLCPNCHQQTATFANKK